MRIFGITILILCAFAVLAFAQATDGTLVGIITDQSGAGVPNAVVNAQNIATGVQLNVKTGAGGEYRFNNVPVGRYNINVTAPGFSPTTLKNIDVILNQTATANVPLQVGTVATTVEVTDAAAVIDTTTAQIQSNYTSEEARYLPMTGLGTAGT